MAAQITPEIPMVCLYHHPSPPFTNWIIENGLLEENFVVIDVGVQGGEVPRWNSLGDRLEFYGFDPITEVIEDLRREGRPGRTYFEMGLGDEDGEREFFVANNSFGSSFLSSSTTELFGDPKIRRGARTVSMRRLDSLSASGVLPRADYLKLDCEGFEPCVLRGGRAYLAASGPFCITSEANFHLAPFFPRTHFQAINEILVEHRLLVFDFSNIASGTRRSYAAARRERPWPEPDPLSGAPHLDVGPPGVLDVVFCRDFVAEALNPASYSFAGVPAEPPGIDRLIKAMINFELYGLMDCAFDIAVHFRERLQQRLDVDKAMELLLLRPPHARFTKDVANCLAVVETLRAMMKQKDALLAERDTLLAQKDARLAERDMLLARNDVRLAQQDAWLAEGDTLLAQKDARLVERDTLLAQKDALLAQHNALVGEQSNELASKDAALRSILDSTSWRLTAPLRKAVTLARRMQ
jgi:FkbM family methyltransferase